jgi:hypothetical protein
MLNFSLLKTNEIPIPINFLNLSMFDGSPPRTPNPHRDKNSQFMSNCLLKINCILGGWANSVVKLTTLDDFIPYAEAQCQVTKYSCYSITNIFVSLKC